jgi:hypothetical protein
MQCKSAHASNSASVTREAATSFPNWKNPDASITDIFHTRMYLHIPHKLLMKAWRGPVFAFPNLLTSDLLTSFQPFQLPLCPSFHFTCFLFFFTFDKLL